MDFGGSGFQSQFQQSRYKILVKKCHDNLRHADHTLAIRAEGDPSGRQGRSGCVIAENKRDTMPGNPREMVTIAERAFSSASGSLFLCKVAASGIRS